MWLKSNLDTVWNKKTLIVKVDVFSGRNKENQNQVAKHKSRDIQNILNIHRIETIKHFETISKSGLQSKLPVLWFRVF